MFTEFRFASPLRLAILFMLTGGVSVTFMQAGVKVLSDELHPFIITFFRAFLVLIILMPVIFHSGVSVLATSSVKLQVIRGLVGGSGMVCVFTGLSLISLAEATTLLFTVPIFTTVMSVLFLSEKVGIRRWLAIIAGFCGTLVVMRPDVSISFGHLLLIYAALAWALSVLIAKKLTQKDNVLSITFWQAAGSVPIALILGLTVWDWPSFDQLYWLFGIAGLGTIGHMMFYAALQRGDVSFIMPLDYLRIIWSAALGYLLFGDMPTIGLFIGGAMIIGATSFISYREMRIRAGKG